MFEYLFSVKISIWVAVIFAAIFRVIRMPTTATTWAGKIFDTAFTFLVSIGGGLMLYQPIMLYFGIGAEYEVIVAMLSALSCELFLNKILTSIKEGSLADMIKGGLKIWK